MVRFFDALKATLKNSIIIHGSLKQFTILEEKKYEYCYWR